VHNKKILSSVETLDYSGTEEAIIDKIEQVLKETIKRPRSADAWGRLGMNLYIHGFSEVAVPVFQKAAALDEDDFRWAYFCAIALNKLNDDTTMEWFERAQNLEPRYPPLSVRYGNRCLIEGELETAERTFELAIYPGVRIPHAHLGLAKVALAKNDLEKARRQIAITLEMAPQFRDAHVLLADVHRRSGDADKAQKELAIIELLPRRMDLADPVYAQMVEEGEGYFWHQVHADKYMTAGQYEEAEAEFKKALAAKRIPESYKNLGLVYQRQKLYDKAIEYYLEALKLDSNYVDALNNLGVVYYESDQVDEAIKCVQKSLKIDPASLEGHLNLGTFYKEAGRYSAALRSFERGMEVAPHDMRFVFQVAWIYATAPQASLRNGEEAVALARRVCEHDNYRTAVSLDLLAAAHAQSGHFEEAVDFANRAYQLAVNEQKRGLADEIRVRRNLYRDNKPFRDK
jgi:superkiller protein 3